MLALQQISFEPFRPLFSAVQAVEHVFDHTFLALGQPFSPGKFDSQLLSAEELIALELQEPQLNPLPLMSQTITWNSISDSGLRLDLFPFVSKLEDWVSENIGIVFEAFKSTAIGENLTDRSLCSLYPQPLNSLFLGSPISSPRMPDSVNKQAASHSPLLHYEDRPLREKSGANAKSTPRKKTLAQAFSRLANGVLKRLLKR